MLGYLCMLCVCVCVFRKGTERAPPCPSILFTLWQPHRNSLAFSIPIKPILSIFTPSAQPNAPLSCMCVCAAALMAQDLADRWRFSSVDESARLVMTSRPCYPIIPCPAPYPRSPQPVPPYREGMMGWWTIGAVREGRENEGKNTLWPSLSSISFP